MGTKISDLSDDSILYFMLNDANKKRFQFLIIFSLSLLRLLWNGRKNEKKYTQSRSSTSKYWPMKNVIRTLYANTHINNAFIHNEIGFRETYVSQTLTGSCFENSDEFVVSKMCYCRTCAWALVYDLNGGRLFVQFSRNTLKLTLTQIISGSLGLDLVTISDIFFC